MSKLTASGRIPTLSVLMNMIEDGFGYEGSPRVKIERIAVRMAIEMDRLVSQENEACAQIAEGFMVSDPNEDCSHDDFFKTIADVIRDRKDNCCDA